MADLTVTQSVDDFMQSSDNGEARTTLALLERYGMTPLVHRRIQTPANVRILFFGDSILPGMVYEDEVGAMRVFQNFLGNAGAGGVGVNAEQIQYFDGSAAYASANWFREYVQVPAGSSYEFSLATPTRGRRFANTVKVAWRAPVGGTATFRIQTCSDADGAGSGTWVNDPAGIRTAVSSGGTEEVGSATLSLSEASYRLRVLGVSGTVDIFNMEVSHSAMNGAVLIPHNEGSTEFLAWANLSDTQRDDFITATDPDCIIVAYKDSAASMTTSLAALLETLAGNLSGGYPRDVVILGPFPTVANGNPLGDADGIAVYEEREVMRDWAITNRVTYIDLWDLAPVANIYYDGNPGVHLAGTDEYAHFGQLILDRLGWLNYPELRANSQPVIRRNEKISFSELANNTTFVEYLRIRGLAAGTYALIGYFQFSNVDAAGEGGKIEVSFGGVAASATTRNYRWTKFTQTTGFGAQVVTPGFGSPPGLPITMNGLTASNNAYGYDLIGTLIVINPGDLIVKAAKEVASGSNLFFREGSFIQVQKQ